MFGILLSLVALAASSQAHTIFQEVYVNGVDQGHINGIRVPDYDGVRILYLSSSELFIDRLSLQPITDVTSNDVICNGGINPYHTPISQVIINANAGDSITAEWHHTLAGADSTDPADPIDASHKGPVIAYM